MANARIRLLSAIPGPTSLSAIVRNFDGRREGVVTAFSDSLLPSCQAFIGDDSLLEVKPFGEVVRLALGMCGEEAMALAQTGHCLAATAQACSELPEESPLYASGRFPGFHEAVWKTLEELRLWRLDPERLGKLSKELQPDLAAKVDSLAKIRADVERTLESLGRGIHTSQLAACVEGAIERDGALDRLLVFAGSNDDPSRADWLRWLARSGCEITVVVDRHASSSLLFERSRRMISLLGSEETPIGTGNRLARELFSDSPKLESDLTGSEWRESDFQLAISVASDPFSEVEWALRECSKLDRPDRSAIFVRDLESYAPLIESAAIRFGVPIRMNRRAPLLTNSFARLTLKALEFCASTDVRSLAPIVRSSYLALDGTQQRKLLSNLREAHRRRSEQWLVLTRWASENESEFPWLSKVLLWRSDALSRPASYGEWGERLRQLIDVLPWHDALIGRLTFGSDRDQRAQSQLQRVLANFTSIERVKSRSTVNLSRFVERCRDLWQAADVSVPTSEMGVTVSSNPEAIGEVDHVCVLGMLEGVFPRRRSEDPILNDLERQQIDDVLARWDSGSFQPLPDSRVEARAERDEFYRLCVLPRHRLVLCYPQTDEDRDNIPAFYLQKLRNAGLVDVELAHDRLELAPQAEDCVTPADRALRAALESPRESASATALNSTEARRALEAAEDASFSPAQLRDALICPFMAVARYRLRLRPKQEGARWHRLQSLPQAANLSTQTDERRAEFAMLQALEAELDELYSDVPEWELQLLRTGGKRLIRDWVKREFASREIWPKQPQSVSVNVPFGTCGLRDKLPGNVRITGTVPAISRLGETNVMHLYGSVVEDLRDVPPSQQLYLGIHFLAMYDGQHESAIEMEGTRGERHLYLLSRRRNQGLSSRAGDGLKIADLIQSEDESIGKQEFFVRVKRDLADSARRIRHGAIEATPGDHCRRCDLGELCRRSLDFGEDDSPFGFDLAGLRGPEAKDE